MSSLQRLYALPLQRVHSHWPRDRGHPWWPMTTERMIMHLGPILYPMSAQVSRMTQARALVLQP